MVNDFFARKEKVRIVEVEWRGESSTCESREDDSRRKQTPGLMEAEIPEVPSGLSDTGGGEDGDGRIEKDEVASGCEYFRKKHGEKEEKNEHEEREVFESS